MYLCGFTLFLSLILNRTYVMILDVLRLEEELKRVKGDPKAGGKAGSSIAGAGMPGEVANLRKELAAANAKVEAMKKQTEGLQREYNRLGTKSPDRTNLHRRINEGFWTGDENRPCRGPGGCG